MATDLRRVSRWRRRLGPRLICNRAAAHPFRARKSRAFIMDFVQVQTRKMMSEPKEAEMTPIILHSGIQFLSI